jgi:hypothetical protein
VRNLHDPTGVSSTDKESVIVLQDPVLGKEWKRGSTVSSTVIGVDKSSF